MENVKVIKRFATDETRLQQQCPPTLLFHLDSLFTPFRTQLKRLWKTVEDNYRMMSVLSESFGGLTQTIIVRRNASVQLPTWKAHFLLQQCTNSSVIGIKLRFGENDPLPDRTRLPAYFILWQCVNKLTKYLSAFWFLLLCTNKQLSEEHQ